MNLNEFQKTLVQAIAAGEVTDFVTCIQKVIGDTVAHGDIKIGESHHGLALNFPAQVVQHPDDTLVKMREFVALQRALESSNLILTVEVKDRGGIYPLYSAQAPQTEYTPFVPALTLLKAFQHLTIVPLPGMKEFIQRGFQTDQEYNRYIEQQVAAHNRDAEVQRWARELGERKAAQSEETKDRRKSMWWTRFIAIASIVIGLGTAVFQYLTYKTERDVVVKNPNAFADTVTVRVAEHQKTDPDSTHLKKKVEKH